jgi:hypothetical protein
MSANWWAGELRKTRRYELGQQLGSVARRLLLMTAAPARRKRRELPGVPRAAGPRPLRGPVPGGGRSCACRRMPP